MNNLLVLPYEHTKEDQSLWRVAIRRGWKTMRFDPNKPEKIEGYDMVRYYGNLLHYMRVAKYLPIRFPEISASMLSDLDISWTRRKIKKIPFGDLELPLKKDTFIKCVNVKWLEAKVYKAGEKPSSQWQGMQDTDLIYVQEPVEFVNEVRCFVIDREVVTASWYRKNKEFCPEHAPLEDEKMTMIVPRAYTHDLTWVTRQFHEPLPRGVVLDWGQDAYGTWSLIEANEAWASGLYDCDPEKVFDTIIASQDNAV